MHEVILVGVDGSVGGDAAVAEAAEVAKRFGAKLIALSVEEGLPRAPATKGEVDDCKDERDRYFEEVRRAAVRIAGEHGSTLRHDVRIGGAADQISHFAQDVKADLIVLGYKGHSRIAEVVIGATAQNVNAHSNASVLDRQAGHAVRRRSGPESSAPKIFERAQRRKSATRKTANIYRRYRLTLPAWKMPRR